MTACCNSQEQLIQVEVNEILCTRIGRPAIHANQSCRILRLSGYAWGPRRAFGSTAVHFVLLDDLLTTGCSFKICRDLWTLYGGAGQLAPAHGARGMRWQQKTG
jgi:hypothetical protein